MSIEPALSEKQQERERLIQRIRQSLQADDRVVAAWLAGSLGRGEADAWSDVDLWVVVRDDAIEAVREGRQRFVEVLGPPILISEAPQNAPPGGAYLWAMYHGEHGPQHVDWNWLPQADAHIPEAAIVLFDRAGLPPASGPVRPRPEGEQLAAVLTQPCSFFWGMCAVIAKYIARGKIYDALGLLDIAAYELSRVEWLLGRGAIMTYRQHVWGSTTPPFTAEGQLDLLRRTANRMESLHTLIEGAGATVPHEAVREIHTLFDLVQQSLAAQQKED
jgi:predicted nucleotidyltransferase